MGSFLVLCWRWREQTWEKMGWVEGRRVGVKKRKKGREKDGDERMAREMMEEDKD